MMPYCSFPHPQFHRSIFATNLDYFPHQIFRGGPPFCTSSRFNPFLRMLLCSDYVSLCCRGYVNQYFDNKEEDVHKDTFRQIAIDVPRMSPLVGLFQQRLVQEMVERILYIWAIRCFILSLNTSSIEIDTLKLIYNVYKCFILPILSIWSLSLYIDHDVQAPRLWLCPGY